MSMSKKDFIALADAIREHNAENEIMPFTLVQLGTLANVLARANSNFMRDRWLAYIASECGPNGGNVKAVRS